MDRLPLYLRLWRERLQASAGKVAKIEAQMRENPAGVKFADLRKVCVHYFGVPRHDGTSHVQFDMPWGGDPRVNIQPRRGMAKTYQVRQAVAAIDKLNEMHKEERRVGRAAQAARYSYRVIWSDEDGEYVGLCAEFPSLSWLASSSTEAMAGIKDAVNFAVTDMVARGQSVPRSSSR